MNQMQLFERSGLTEAARPAPGRKPPAPMGPGAVGFRANASGIDSLIARESSGTPGSGGGRPYDALCSDRGMYRRADPATSRTAARLHVRRGRKARNMILLDALVRQYPDRTACELHAMLIPQHQEFMNRYEVSRRLADLRDQWATVESGRARACRIAGTRQMTWRAAMRLPTADQHAAGLAALRSGEQQQTERGRTA